MQCPRCGAENREGSNFCRYCSETLTQPGPAQSGYIPSVPPPNSQAQGYRPPQNFQTPPQPPLPRPVVPAILCPRCHNASVLKGTTPLWAILVAVIGAPFTCLLSLLFLLVKDPHRCINCGLEFK
jgi:zinc ribbon protein